MNTMPDSRSHAHAETLLDDHVMGLLPAADQAWMDEHIISCAICQAEVPLLLEATFALPFAVDEPPVEMSDDLWDRIAGSIDLLPRAHVAGSSEIAVSERGTSLDPASTWPQSPAPQSFVPLDLGPPEAHRSRKKRLNVTSMSAYKWLAVAAAAVVILGVGAVLARNLLWTNEDSPTAQTIAMVDAEGTPVAGTVAHLAYLPDDGRLVLDMDAMPPAPDGQIYQAWLIAGDVPVPIGTVDPASGEFTHEMNLTEFDAFAITVEPGPSGSPLPTSNPIIVAPLVPAV